MHVMPPLMALANELTVNSLFISDTSVERNTLMEQVYPKLKSFCQERGYDFQVVDMRWGIREEATDDHLMTELCMRELTTCQKLSTGPNFVVSTTCMILTWLRSRKTDQILPTMINVETYGNQSEEILLTTDPARSGWFGAPVTPFLPRWRGL